MRLVLRKDWSGFACVQELKTNDGEIRKGKAKTETGWQQQHAKLRAEMGIGNEQLWPETEMVGVTSMRARDLIQIAWSCATRKNHTENLVVDVSQSAVRRPWSQGFRSMTTGSSFFVFSLGRLLCSSEHFRILGFSSMSGGSLGSSAMKDLAGESMGVAPVTLATLSVAACLGELWYGQS